MLAVVAAGGAIGSGARFLVETALPARPGAFPAGTFVINVTGCLLLGVLMVIVTELTTPHRYVRPFLGVGVLGGYTTFSTAAEELRALAGGGDWLVANLYAVDSVLAGLAAVWAGVILTRLLAGRPIRRYAVRR